MSLSRKHYQAIATVLKSYQAPGLPIPEAIARELADYFASDNPNFDRARFLTACGVTALSAAGVQS